MGCPEAPPAAGPHRWAATPEPGCGPWLMPSSTATAMAVSGERCPTIFPHGGPSTTTLQHGNETKLSGRPSMTSTDGESGGEPVGRQPPAPAVSIARPSRRPKGVASMVTTVPSGSPVGSIISPWIPWGCFSPVADTSAAVDDAAAAPKVLGQLTRKSFPRLRKSCGRTPSTTMRPEPMDLEERVVCD